MDTRPQLYIYVYGLVETTIDHCAKKFTTADHPSTCFQALLQQYLRAPKNVLCIMSSMMEGKGRQERQGKGELLMDVFALCLEDGVLSMIICARV